MSIVHEHEGNRMVIQFQPRGKLKRVDGKFERVDVRDLAAALGVDHFNWKNKIIGLPGSLLVSPNKFVTWHNVSNPADVNLTNPVPTYSDGTAVQHTPFVTVPILDPPPMSTDYLATYFNGNWQYGVGPFDNYPYYYNETGSTGRWQDQVDRAEGVQYLEFLDEPSMAKDVPPGQFFYFDTELVGVREDKTELPLGIGVRWKTNAKNATFQFVYATFTNPNLPPIESGRIYDVTTYGLNSGLDGDFTEDGIVDAADYVVWRKGLGTDFIHDDYELWRSNYGQTVASIPSTLAIPEPSTMVLSSLFVLLFVRIKQIAHRRGAGTAA